MVLIDLSRALECLPHDLLIANLHAYGFDHVSIKLIENYFSQRKRVTVVSSYSKWLYTRSDVPHGYFLAPLLFNILLNDFIYAIEHYSEACNFADDNTTINEDTNLDKVICKLEVDFGKALFWFKSNHIVANTSKFQLLFLGMRNIQDILMEVNGVPTEMVKVYLVLW